MNKMWTETGKETIYESSNGKLLGVTIDNKLNFDSPIASIYLKANQTLSVLDRLSKLLYFDKKRPLF